MDRLPDPPPDPGSSYLSTEQVAKAVGVSVTTIKRWVDEGILPAHKTPGGHRKLVLADVLRLTREGELPPADPCELLKPTTRGDSAEPAYFQRQLEDAIRRIDGGQIRAILRAAYQSRVPMAALADRVIAPAMRFVGHEWELNRVDVATEHRITQAVVASMYELRGLILANATRNRPVAIGGAIEGDHYVLPTLMAKLTLLEAGWDAVNVGPNTPAAALIATIERLKPKLVWVSVSHVPVVDDFERDYKHLYYAAHARGVAVALGGRALTPELRARLPYTTFGDGMTQLAAFARSLHPLPQRPKRGRPAKKL
ncbi:helix-turn-helix domain-containing protein [Limnoglobus roseus]|uniref:HTH-type transcriptional repressor CarH n=1 Tax=Limnoglobus roseus TaxID=2598579 RepID=A0A5C1AD44_9BACT|nr:helix-turn-helix domain-containing protein [Limnoglobus roseus]QEL17279.1 HTH-type transcriptional repressor CarH [Limnoglobus roseus]